jgi:hypothetical protein
MRTQGVVVRHLPEQGADLVVAVAERVIARGAPAKSRVSIAPGRACSEL